MEERFGSTPAQVTLEGAMGEPLTAGDFVRQWTGRPTGQEPLPKVIVCVRWIEDLAALAVPEGQTAFLRIAGLPEDAAPIMTFGSEEFPYELESAWGSLLIWSQIRPGTS
jgi:hypothetical protein